MEERDKMRRHHSLSMDNRGKMRMTGINDVVSFDENKIVLDTDYGSLTVKGNNLHVNRLSVEKGELDVDGMIDAFAYAESKSSKAKGETLMSRLFG